MNAKSIRPAWAFDDRYLVNFLYSSESCQILALEGLDHHYDLLCKLVPSMWVLVFIPSNNREWNFGFAAKCLKAENSRFPLSHICWLCNYEDQVGWAKSQGFSAILCHQNAFINEEIFKLPFPLSTRQYDLVLNTRPEAVKRPWLALGLSRLAVIRGKLYHESEYYDLNQLKPEFINEQRISAVEVNDVYARSNVGGIFSESEGGCLASGEYLLAGLPVLSTICTGGRETYYDASNSVVVEPTSAAVASGLEILLTGLATGRYDRVAIRDRHIVLSRAMRQRLLDYLMSSIFQDAALDGLSRSIVRKLMTKRVHWLRREEVLARWKLQEKFRYFGGNEDYINSLERLSYMITHDQSGTFSVQLLGSNPVAEGRFVSHLTPNFEYSKHYAWYEFSARRDLPTRFQLSLHLRGGGFPFAVVELLHIVNGEARKKRQHKVPVSNTSLRGAAGNGAQFESVLLDLGGERKQFLELSIEVERSPEESVQIRVYVDSMGEYIPRDLSSILISNPVVI